MAMLSDESLSSINIQNFGADSLSAEAFDYVETREITVSTHKCVQLFAATAELSRWNHFINKKRKFSLNIFSYGETADSLTAAV